MFLILTFVCLFFYNILKYSRNIIDCNGLTKLILTSHSIRIRIDIRYAFLISSLFHCHYNIEHFDLRWTCPKMCICQQLFFILKDDGNIYFKWLVSYLNYCPWYIRCF